MNVLYVAPLLVLLGATAAILAAWRAGSKRKLPPPQPAPGPFLRLTAPLGGETWSPITEHQITGESSQISGTVNVVLVQGERVGPGILQDHDVGFVSGPAGDIAKDLPIGAGSFSWKVGDYEGAGYPPPSVDPGQFYKIRIRSGTDYQDDSDYFTILPYPELGLTTPNGGTWQPENVLNISWRARYFPPDTTVRLELYKDLSYHETLATDLPIELEHYEWDLSGIPGTEGWPTYHLRLATMQSFWENFFWKEFTDFSHEPFYILGFDQIALATMYEGHVSYKKSTTGFWLRDDPSAVMDPGWYRNYAEGFTDPNVHALLNDIGCPPGGPTTEEETWNRIQLLWEWLKTPGHIRAGTPAELNSLTADPIHNWPSISDYAAFYRDQGQLVWGACNSKAQLFANLLIQMTVSQSRFVIATAHHDLAVDDGIAPLEAMHEYIAIYVNGRWFYLDPNATQEVAPPVDFPDFHHACSTGVKDYISRIDYEHPYHIDPPPECSDAVLLGRVAPCLPR